MARNASGTYTLPAGNPVTTATTITSTWANNTLNDIAAEFTDSLSRSGKGAMTAPLQLPDGSAAAPAATFSSDTDTGLYRVGANDLGVTVAGAQVAHVTSSALTIATVLNAPAGSAAAPSLAFSTDTNTGLYSVGADDLGIAVGGSQVAHVTGTALTLVSVLNAPAGTAAAPSLAFSTDTNTGLYSVGADDLGISVGGTQIAHVTASAFTTSQKIVGVGAAGVVGGSFANGTAATGATPQNALELTNGHLKLSGTNPNSTVGHTNVLTAMNVPKAWARIQSNGSGSISVLAGFNVASIAIVTNTIARLTLAAALSNTSGCAFGTFISDGSGLGNDMTIRATIQSTTTVDVSVYDHGAAGDVNFSTAIVNCNCLVFSEQ